MTARRIYNVDPTGKEEWEVKEKHASRAVKVFENKSNAVGRARKTDAKLFAANTKTVTRARTPTRRAA